MEKRNAEGISTKVIVAALKYRYNTVGKHTFEFKGLAEPSKNPKPHHPVPIGQRSNIDQMFAQDIKTRLACKLLYDLGARVQDLVELTFVSFKPTPEGGAHVQWKPNKQKKADVVRKCFVSADTMELVR